MKFKSFYIENFKGIKQIDFNLDKSPDANIYTLVGLNESGKTTILEAINLFNFNSEGINALGLPGVVITDYHTLIPISLRDNFNGITTIMGTLIPDKDDWQKIETFAKQNTSFDSIVQIKEITWSNRYVFEDSKFVKTDNRWMGLSGILKAEPGKVTVISDSKFSTDNLALATFVKSLFPSVLYYPNFLFDFPEKIYLESKATLSSKEKFYVELIQDILYSLDNNTTIETHLIARIKSNTRSDKRNLDALLQKMGKQVTEVIIEAWNKVFKRTLRDTKIIIRSDIDENGLSYLEFDIEAPDGIYQINERSLGFKWFFIFLLFTQFRPFRKDSSKNVIFLFDEPASNLHPIAQQQLLKSFENLTRDCKVIYTTHSHHLINPHWLESTYVVKNEGLRLEDIEAFNIKQTDISIQSYRDFANNHPHNIAYFQPILDVLDYTPSELELIPSCVFLEGKNDYYSLKYFNDVIIKGGANLHLAPSTGSGNLDTLISLYLGWGKKFIVLLDSDKEGDKQKKRYVENFGVHVENKIFQFKDVDGTWSDKVMEKIFDVSELLPFQQTCYPTSTEFNKVLFSRSIQENLIKKKEYSFSDETRENFRKVISFLKQKIDEVFLK